MRPTAFAWPLLLCGCATTAPPGLGDAPIELTAPVVADIVGGAAVPVIEMELDGRPWQRFLIDSGAELTVLDVDRVRALGVPVTRFRGDATATGSSGSDVEIEHEAHIGQLRVDGLVVGDGRAIAMESPVFEYLDVTGLVGQDVLRRLVVIIDMQRRKVHFLPGSYGRDEIGDYVQAQRLGGGGWRRIGTRYGPCPTIDIRVRGLEGASVEMKLDTGATGSSMPAFAVEAMALEPTGTTRTVGLSGEREVPTYTLKRFGLFAYDLEDLSIHGMAGDYGLLGMDVLGKFVVVLDGPNDALWFHHRDLDR